MFPSFIIQLCIWFWYFVKYVFQVSNSICSPLPLFFHLQFISWDHLYYRVSQNQQNCVDWLQPYNVVYLSLFSTLLTYWKLIVESRGFNRATFDPLGEEDSFVYGGVSFIKKHTHTVLGASLFVLLASTQAQFIRGCKMKIFQFYHPSLTYCWNAL